jgi:hypothetical protein
MNGFPAATATGFLTSRMPANIVEALFMQKMPRIAGVV